jgi:hypothetical protein
VAAAAAGDERLFVADRIAVVGAEALDAKRHQLGTLEQEPRVKKILAKKNLSKQQASRFVRFDLKTIFYPRAL